ncbi:RVT_3 domain-containing protein [Senna tora]|uniref:RVT_3 domain-containing protein n=1 Tax=Senna tora TaxID=362788 RepID=A0A834TKQ4_9FABA|nr:RVT_3 domain-containing protein [Senna tora]
MHSFEKKTRKKLNSSDVQSLSSKDLTLFYIMGCKVWERRNCIRVGDIVQDMTRLWEETKWVYDEMNDSKMTVNREDEAQGSNATSVVWKPPHWSILKINVDASFNGQGSGGVGCIVRNHRGRCLAALAKRVPYVSDAETLEVHAFLMGLELASDLRATKIVVEGDARRVVDLVKSNMDNLSILGMLATEIKAKMTKFRECYTEWVPRDANKIADRLAHYACNVALRFG